MRVMLKYTAPVMVEVDIEKGAVSRVVVLDEEAEFVGPEPREGPEGVTVTEYLAAAKEAKRVADEMAWPAWELGF